MKNFFTLTLCFLTLSITAQIDNFPFNPDSNSDGFISVDDLMAMLSNFGEPFELPDYTEWSTGTMNNLLEYNESLNLLSDSLSALQSQLSSIQENMESYLDSAINVALTAIDDYFESVKDYYVVYDGTSNCCSINIPTNCRHLTLAGWNQGSPTSTMVEVRLPLAGLFIGQTIEIRLTEVWNMNGSVTVEGFINGDWQSVGNLSDNPNVGPAQNEFGYLTNDYQNEKFVWNGSVWENVPISFGALNWTEN